MATAARDRLAKVLRGDAESAFSTELTARMEALTLDVAGFGRAKFPVTPAKARKLIGLGKPARFGKGEETLTDPDVRDTWEIPTGLVTATWDPGTLRDVLATVKEDLGLPSAAELTADLHSLLVYEPNQFFLKHQDTEKSDDMIGTLVVTLPSTYGGGDLMVGQGEEWKAYPGSRNALSLVAFYADCQHEVLKIKSGYRVILTYNLLLHGDTTTRPEGDAGTIEELADLLREHFTTPATPSWGGQPANPPSRLVYLLDHEYTPRALAWTRLKGADAQRVPLLRKAAEDAGYEAVLGLADVKSTHDAWPADEGYGYRRRRYYDDDDYDAAYESGAGAARNRKYEINELITSEVTLTHWTGPDGTQLEHTSLSVRDAEACASTPSGNLEPYESQYEGYMGNWGNTLDRWYHRGAIVVWPQAQAFANRAETSPQWALDELTSMASAGDVAGARDAAATLEPFWAGLDHGHSTREDGTDSTVGLLSRALRAADAVADSGVAAMLLKPFTITRLARDHAEPLGRITADYGPEWTDSLLRGWFGGDRPTWNRSEGQADWVATWLPGICSDLHTTGCGETARRLLELSWDRIQEDASTGLAMSSPSHRDRRLAELGKPVAALLTAATATRAANIRESISGFITGLDGDPVTALQLAALRAALATDPTPGRDGLGEIAADCTARLHGRLNRPRRDASDWSIILPAGGCACELCGTLRDFLADAGQRTFQWPLAEQGRRHVHSRIDGAELPVTHETRREGRPYTLVLTKTSALHAGERAARERDELDLAWVAGCLG
jgi:2OG-Fe(II) oxygenase superfamily